MRRRSRTTTRSNENSVASYDSLGDFLRAVGDYAGAAAAFADWLNTATKLASGARDPHQADYWLSYAADAHLRLGDISVQRKQLDDEISEYKRGIEIAEKISADDPENTKYIETASMGHGKLGEALVAAGRLVTDFPPQHSLADLSGVGAFAQRARADGRGSVCRSLRRIHLLPPGRGGHAPARSRLRQCAVRRVQRSSIARRRVADAKQAGRRGARIRARVPERLEVERRSPPTNQAAKKILAMADYRLGLLAEAKADKVEAIRRYRDCFDIKFLRDTWMCATTDPEDVTQACHDRLAQLGASP